MRVNGLKLRTKRVLGAASLLLALCFVGGYITAELSNENPPEPFVAPRPLQIRERPEKVELTHDLQESNLDEATLLVQRYKQKHRELSQTIKEDFHPYEALLERGDLYLELTLYERARRDFQEAIEHKDDSFEGYLGRGRASFGLGDFDNADEDLTEAYNLNFSRAEAALSIARLKREQGRFDSAFHYYSLATQRSPAKDATRNEWAELCEESGKFTKARELYSHNKQSSNDEQRAIAILGLRRLDDLQTTSQRQAVQKPKEDIDNVRLLLDHSRYELHLDESPEMARSSLERVVVLGREYRSLCDSFNSWRLKPKKVLNDSEKVHRDAFTLLCLLRARFEDKFDLRSRLGDLSQWQLEAWQRSLVNVVAFDDSKCCDDYRKQLLESQSVSARAFKTARLPKAELSRFEHFGQSVYQNKRLALSRLLYLNPWHYELQFERAKVMAQIPDRSRLVIQDLRAVLAVHPHHWRARLELAHCYAKSGPKQSFSSAVKQYKIVIEQIEMALFSQSDSDTKIALAEAHFAQALCFARLDPSNSETRVLAHFREALEQLPQSIPRGLLLAEEYHQTKANYELLFGDEVAAEKDREAAQRCRELRQQRSTEHCKDGVESHDQRRYDDAVRALTLALAYNPKNVQAIWNRGVCHLKTGFFLRGVFDLCRTIELDYHYKDRALRKIFQCVELHRSRRAIDEADRSVRKHPNDAHIRFLRGILYLLASEYRDSDSSDLLRAKDDMTRALELNQGFVSAYEMRGYIHSRMSKFREAHQDLNQVESFLPDALNAKLYRALTFAKEYRLSQNAALKISLKEKAKLNLKRYASGQKGCEDYLKRFKDLENLFSTQDAYRKFVSKHAR